MIKLSRIFLRLKTKPMAPEHRLPVLELGGSAQPLGQLYTELETSAYRTKRKTALLVMFGPDNG